MKTRVVFSDFSRSNLPLAIAYHFDNNQFSKITDLTNIDNQKTGPSPGTLLAKTIKIGEMVLVQTQMW